MALLDLNASATSRLGLEPIKDGQGGYRYNGCIPTRISSVVVGYQEHKKGEFIGKQVPVLTVDFENYKTSVTEVDRYLTHSFKPVGSKELLEGTSDQYKDRDVVSIIQDNNDLWKAIKHFLEALSNSPSYRNIVNIPKSDFTEYFDLPELGTADERIAKYKKFFTYIADFVNGDGKEIKSQILTADNKQLPIWVKLLPNYDKDPKRDKKFYTVPRFIGQGVFEALYEEKGIPLSPRIIKVKATESLELSANRGASMANMTGTNPIPNGIGGIDPSVANLLNNRG